MRFATFPASALPEMCLVHSTSYVKPFLAWVAALGLAACATAPTQAPSEWHYQGQKFGALRVSMAPGVQIRLARDGSFDLWRFEQTLLNALKEQRLYDRASGYSVSVELTDVRLGAEKPAGNLVTGKVTLKQPSGRALYAFDVHAAYALGDSHATTELLSGLYEEFAVLTIIQILSGSEPKSAYASL